MPRGRPRLPTRVLEARGTYVKDPQRRAEREGEPEGDGEIGPPPARLSALQRKAWKDTVANAHPGMLSSSDRDVLELLAVVKAEFWEKGTAFTKHGQYLSLLGRLGMTPADRSYVKVAPDKQPKKRNAFADMRGGGTGQ